MLKRFLIVLSLLLLPLGAAAEGTSDLSPAAPVDNGPSNSVGTSLQPAGTQDLQPAGAASGGVTQSGDNISLQTAGNQQDVKTFGDLTVGSATHTLPASHQPSAWWILLPILLVGFGWWFYFKSVRTA